MTTSDQPLVTVAMVTYNSAKYVRMAIDSVLASSYTNIELIISDDCSSDQTWQIVQDYSRKDSRVKAFRNETNIGEYPNRTKICDYANGEYLIYIDGDDMIYPWGIEYTIKQLNNHSGIGMVLAMEWRDYIFYPFILKPRENFLFTYFGESVLTNSFAQTLFRTEKLKEILPFPSNIISGDTYIKKLISIDNDVLLISGPIAWWRRTPGQASLKLNNNTTRILDNLKIDQAILSKPNVPLSIEEKLLIEKAQHSDIIKTAIKLAAKLKLNQAFTLIKNVNLKYVFKLSLKKEPIYKSNADSANPLMMS